MPNTEQAREKYARHAATTYRRGQDRPSPVRLGAIARLGLMPGNTVLDVGCGSGLSFPLLEEAIGLEGRIIGIDQSPDMLARARECIERHDWQNVTLMHSPAEDAAIPAKADAALFHLTHDIMRTPSAVARVVHHLKPEGRVVAMGIKWAPWWRFRINFRVWRLARAYTTTSFEGLRAPWSYLAELIPDLQVESIGLCDRLHSAGLTAGTVKKCHAVSVLPCGGAGSNNQKVRVPYFNPAASCHPGDRQRNPLPACCSEALPCLGDRREDELPTDNTEPMLP